jgi:hypothetical protein
MEQNDVKVGEIYLKRVSGKSVRIRINREAEYAGRKRWYATNIITGREIYVRSAASLHPQFKRLPIYRCGLCQGCIAYFKEKAARVAEISEVPEIKKPELIASWYGARRELAKQYPCSNPCSNPIDQESASAKVSV